MTPRVRAAHSLTATSFLLSLLACSSHDVTPDGGSKGGTPGPTAGGSAGQGGAQGSGGATQKGAGGAPGFGGQSGLGGIKGSGGAGTGGGTALDGGSGSGGSPRLDGGLDGAGIDGSSAAGGKPGTGGTPGGGGSPGTGGSGTAGTTGASEYGFTYRSPGSHAESCTGIVGTLTINAPDQDWLCTFNVASQQGYVYARTTANGALCLYANAFPTYKVELAQMSIGGVVTDLANPKYDGGGNHHNDALSFDYQGSTYKYFHSSFGIGGRRCQDMDCINIYAVGGMTPTTEGCASTRSLPEVCVQIAANGTHGPLVDKFAKCPGDTSK